jgi:hypothetical protein
MGSSWRRFARVFHFAPICALASVSGAYSQSTFGTVLGSILDRSGRAVPDAMVVLANRGTNSIRSTGSALNGSYELVNVDIGTYQLRVEAPGFQTAESGRFELKAQEAKRIDVNLQVAAQATTLDVEALTVLQTDTSNIAQTKSNRELTDLPLALAIRSFGTTSAYWTLAAQPGVQTDPGGNIVISGALPSQLSFSIDGISSVGPGSLGVLSELFPSTNAIEEIRLSETLNPAEYGGVADVAIVSKSGTNTVHGGAFENLQNTDLNAGDTFSHTTSPIKMNDFGAYLGGPVTIPKLYRGRNRMFFFGSYEVNRLAKVLTDILSVPTLAMRNGDLSAYSDPLIGYPGNIIPHSRISTFARNLLNLFYPLPNYGPPGDVANNYLLSFSSPINSTQGDIRLDEIFSSRHLVYARYTHKNRRKLDFPVSPLVGTTSKPEVYNALTVAHNWIITPSLVNELRGGFSSVHRDVRFGLTSQQTANALGLTVPPLPGPIPPGDDVPTLNITGFFELYSPTAGTNPHEGTYQVLDTLSWATARHTLKFGGDFRYLSSLFTQAANNVRLGSYVFNGSELASLLGNSAATPFASFLLGYPDLTAIATVVNPNTDANSKHYAFFGQDDWRISRSLTFNLGLRWEYNPMFLDKNDNVANFDPYFTSLQNRQPIRGAVIVPDRPAFANVNPGFEAAIYPTPVITASQAGVPKALRFSSKTDFAPRIGFAWRIFGTNKTVLRGGYGRFFEALLSSGAAFGWSLASTNTGYFPNSIDTSGKPLFQLPYSYPTNIAQPGTQVLQASEIHYKDPVVDEWNATLERNLGRGVSLRASYDGNHSRYLGTLVNSNQLRVNTTGFTSLASNVPFPALSLIATLTPLGFGNYHAGTLSIRKRARDFQFEGTYVYTRNLTNVNGVPFYSAGGFVNQFGGVLSDPYNPSVDYGNTPFARRHRLLATFLYEIPFGKGKAFLNASSGVVDRLVGGWVLSGVAVFQSGPFLTVATLNDPSGTGYNVLQGIGGRADTVRGVDPYAGQLVNRWINPAAFADPPNNIGRFGDSQQGAVVGPGTRVVSMSLLKRVSLAEAVRLEFGAQVSNLTNHPNYEVPFNLTVGVPGFGQITALQDAVEGAGPRVVQLTARLLF